MNGGFKGICSTGTGTAFSAAIPGADFDNSGSYTLGWTTANDSTAIGGESAGGGSNDTDLKGNSICAKACSALLDWTHDGTTNLPDSASSADT
jgi:hypothetical protein